MEEQQLEQLINDFNQSNKELEKDINRLNNEIHTLAIATLSILITAVLTTLLYFMP